jgi:hypothetical protein
VVVLPRSISLRNPIWDFDRLLKAENKTKWRSRDLNPFIGIFGFYAYVAGMEMSTHVFTHV